MNIEDEWNKIAEERLLDRLKGNDTSYNNVLLPIIIENIKKYGSNNKILDFGCGTGELTYEISKISKKVIGLDISSTSIILAKKYFNNNNLLFTDKPIFLFEEKNFDIIVANMSLMDTEFIVENVNQIYKKLKVNGKFLVTVIHPAFWPIYWNYCDEDFNYLIEKKITTTFRTKTKVFKGFETSHYHRPISFYINMFTNINFKILNLSELKNDNDTTWYPRFLYFELEK